MARRVLFCATVDSHILSFHLPYLRFFREQGYEVHVASKGDRNIPFCHEKFDIPFDRSPFSLNNIKAYKLIKKLLAKNKYEVMHLNTPMGGVVGRFAGIAARKQGTKIIYTAHGFHFYKGAPIINWILYFPVEKWLARYTDYLITINEEDYRLVLKKHFRAGRLAKVYGVGVDTTRFYPVSAAEKDAIREKKGLNKNDFILIYPAELSNRKNQQLLIRIVSMLSKTIPQIKLLLPGRGKMRGGLEKLARELGVEHNIQFLGYRDDINELAALSDVAVSSSRQEGLPVNIIEAMACGKPVVASRIRGHVDLIKDGCNGFLFDLNSPSQAAKAISLLHENRELYGNMSINSSRAVERFSLSRILKEMSVLYRQNFADFGNDPEISHNKYAGQPSMYL